MSIKDINNKKYINYHEIQRHYNHDQQDTHICRVCLNNTIDLLPLFGNITPKNSAMLNFCTTIQAEVNDGFPDQICKLCSNNLKIAYDFKTLAEKSNDVLVDRLFLSKIKTNEENPLDIKPFSIAAFNVPKVLKKIEFNSIEDIKNKLNDKKNSYLLNITKTEPEVDVSFEENMVICNTVIKKVDKDDDIPLSNFRTNKKEPESDDDFFWKSDDIPSGNDYCDDDYDNVKDRTFEIETPKKNKKIRIKRYKNADKMVKIKIKRLPDLSQSTTENMRLQGPIKLLKPIPVSNGGDAYVKQLMKNLENSKYPSDVKKPKAPKPDGQPKKRKITEKNKSKHAKEKHVCPVCGILTFGLATHLLIHEDRKPFFCEICKKSFIQKANYDMHLKKHTGIKEHVCEICGAAFFFIKSINRHKLIHKGERPFPCNLCPKTFLQNCDLTRHLKVHAGYKPFKCMECTMSFNAKHQLTTHIRMHTGEKPYSCEICKLLFTYKVNLNNHVYKVHGVNLKFKSIYTVTTEVLNREYENEHNAGNPSSSMTMNT